MTYPFSIVYSLLMPYRGSIHLDPRQKKHYRWVQLLPEDPKEMDPDILYVCRLSEALERKTQTDGFQYVCIRNCSYPEDEEEVLLEGIAVIDEPREVSWLYNLIQNRFLQLADWENRLQNALLQGCGYQQLLDESEEIFCNALFILDAAYRLLAHSKRYPSSDPINISLVEKGYHTKETVEKLRRFGRLQLYSAETGLLFSDPGQVSKFETVSQWCHYQGANLLHVVLVFNHLPRTNEFVALFEILMNYINIRFQQEQKARQTSDQPHSLFMRDMLYGGLTDEHLIAEYAKRTGVPFTGYFDAYRIVFENSGTVLPGRFIEELTTYLPHSKVIGGNNEISVLNIYLKEQSACLSQCNLEKLSPLLEQSCGICGVSEPFHRLMDFPHACLQASRALDLGYTLSHAQALWPSVPLPKAAGSVFFYRDIFPYHVVQAAGEKDCDVFRGSAVLSALDRLRMYDQERKSNWMEVLHCYLKAERSATAAGALLHMHRNNVLYHISKIEEFLCLDLGDFQTRLGLLLGFSYLELQQARAQGHAP